MPQPNDYEWFRARPWAFRCYPGRVAGEGHSFLLVLGRRSAFTDPRTLQPMIVWAAWWCERHDMSHHRIEWDGHQNWYSKDAAMKAAVDWHRHVVESYDGHHDLELQKQGYGNVPRT